MLVLRIKEGGEVVVGDQVVLKVVELRQKSIRLGIQAPRDVRVRMVKQPDVGPNNVKQHTLDNGVTL